MRANLSATADELVGVESDWSMCFQWRQEKRTQAFYISPLFYVETLIFHRAMSKYRLNDQN